MSDEPRSLEVFLAFSIEKGKYLSSTSNWTVDEERKAKFFENEAAAISSAKVNRKVYNHGHHGNSYSGAGTGQKELQYFEIHRFLLIEQGFTELTLA